MEVSGVLILHVAMSQSQVPFSFCLGQALYIKYLTFYFEKEKKRATTTLPYHASAVR